MKNTDIDGLVFEDEIDDIPELFAESESSRATQDSDEMMVDTIAQEEEEELDAMFSMLETQPRSQPPAQPDSPFLSDDDDYDSIFMDLLNQQQQQQQQKLQQQQSQPNSSPGLVLSGDMDMS